MIFSILNEVAYSLLRVATLEKIKNMVGPGFAAELTLVLFATLGTIAILQSFTIKLADHKFVDLGPLMERLRGRVLEDIVRGSAGRERSRSFAVADRLYQKFHGDSDRLRNEYASVMSFGGRTIGEIGQELAELERDATAANLSFDQELARRIARVDMVRAQQLLSSD